MKRPGHFRHSAFDNDTMFARERDEAGNDLSRPFIAVDFFHLVTALHANCSYLFKGILNFYSGDGEWREFNAVNMLIPVVSHCDYL